MSNEVLEARIGTLVESFKVGYATTLYRMHKGFSTKQSKLYIAVDDSSKAIDEMISSLSKVLREEDPFEFYSISYGSLGKDRVLAMGSILEDAAIVVIFRDENTTSIELDIYGNISVHDKVVSYLKENYDTDCVVVSEVSGEAYGGELILYNRVMSKKTQNTARASFYPWLKTPLDQYFQDYISSDEPVLLLYGPAGTGKSTFIRSLIFHTQGGVLIAPGKDVAKPTSVVSGFYREKDVRFLIYEDADTLVTSRENGNEVMTSLLQASDGIIQTHGRKLILTLNQPTLDKVDPALLREGRCFDALYFPELTADQARLVLEDLGREPKTFNDNETYSLARVLRRDSSAGIRSKRTQRSVGF